MEDGFPPAIHAKERLTRPAEVSELIRDLPQDTVPVGVVGRPISARAEPENPAHVRVLAESEADFGPILVHRETMRVIDGTHRLRAAERRGRQTIEVQYFEGAEADAFVLAVQLNVRHGMPLTLAERKAAALRIMRSHPQWSDRSVAQCAGLSPKTVGKLRRRASEEIPQLSTRIGRDGRVRPVDAAPGRRHAAARLQAEPHLRLIELAECSGVSVGTARDVRDRLNRGESPVPARRRPPGDGTPRPPATPVRAVQRRQGPLPREASPELRRLAGDPAFRGTETGRLLLRMLVMTELDAEQWQAIMDNVPPHCVPLIKNVAARRVEEWSRLADLRQPFRSAV